MKEISFAVQGSAAEPYEVSFIKKPPTTIIALCSCPAGQNGQYCRHRLAIIDGNATGIVSDNRDQVMLVKEWISGTDLENVISEYRDLEERAAEINKALSNIKRKMARIMQNG